MSKVDNVQVKAATIQAKKCSFAIQLAYSPTRLQAMNFKSRRPTYQTPANKSIAETVPTIDSDDPALKAAYTAASQISQKANTINEEIKRVQKGISGESDLMMISNKVTQPAIDNTFHN